MIRSYECYVGLMFHRQVDVSLPRLTNLMMQNYARNYRLGYEHALSSVNYRL